jgi:hypothetical protein
MHLSSLQKKVGLALLAIVVLVVAVWRIAWHDREPRHQGRTVTAWLDSLVLSTNETRRNGDVITVYRAPNEIVADPAFQALQTIGARGVRVLMKRIAEPAGYPPEMSRSERWSTRWRWTWYRWRGPTKATRPVSGSWPQTQTARKTAAALMLVALGTNSQGGYARLMETCAAAPRFTSVDGAKLAGAPLGFAPSSAVKLASSTCPQLRDEIVAGVMQGLQHTNPMCQSMAVDCARVFPELRDIVESREKIQ